MQQTQEQKATADTEYVRSILSTHIEDTRLKQELKDLLSGDYALGNFTSADRQYFRLKADNIGLFVEETHPPAESWGQGLLGAALYDDPEYGMHALEDKSKIRMQTVLMDHFALTSRAVDGWQQEKFSENIQTRRMEDNRDRDEETTLGGLFS